MNKILYYSAVSVLVKTFAETGAAADGTDGPTRHADGWTDA